MVDGVVARLSKAGKRPAPRCPTTPIADPQPGSIMLYSSGTTGRPKGVRFPLPERAARRSAQCDRHSWRRGCTASRPTRSICRPRRSITPRRCAGRWRVQQLGGDRGRDGAVRPRSRARRDREVPRHPGAVGADALHPHAEAAGGGAREIRRVVAEGRVPRRRAVPDPGQARDDRMVGPDHPRILCRHRRQRLLRDQRDRVAGRSPARSGAT